MSYFLFSALLLAVLVACLLHHRVATKRFNERFPPIDDCEFMRRCAPGVSRDVALRVRRIISHALGIEYERIYPEQSFVNDLDAG
jgi:hypothetical protein